MTNKRLLVTLFEAESSLATLKVRLTLLVSGRFSFVQENNVAAQAAATRIFAVFIMASSFKLPNQLLIFYERLNRHSTLACAHHGKYRQGVNRCLGRVILRPDNFVHFVFVIFGCIVLALLRRQRYHARINTPVNKRINGEKTYINASNIPACTCLWRPLPDMLSKPFFFVSI